VLSHASRQFPPWLIFDVRQNMPAVCPECGATLIVGDQSCSHCGWTRFPPLQPAPRRKKIPWWLWTLLSPVGGLAAGILISIARGQHQDDWFGFRAAMPIMFGMLSGCALSCVCALVSLEKREERSTIAFIAAIPSGLFVAFAILSLLGFIK
jgi:hypothetical protein